MTAALDKKEGNCFWRYDPDCFNQMSASVFDANHWKKQNAITGQESGRGTTWFIQHHQHELVLRHYLRGGMMRHFSRDKYLFSQLQNTRAIAEFDILNRLIEKKLPVPKPAAAQIVKQGCFYSADLLTHKIPQAQDLVQVCRSAQTKEFYHALGRLVSTFHQAGVYHADLNIQNILQDQKGQFWLIDFDRARMLSPEKSWQNKTLSRLKRSFEKERERFGIQWTEQDWQSLMQGYQA